MTDRRRQCRRPIQDHEVGHLERMGAALRAVREGLGVTPTQLARAAQINRSTLWRIELGERRTRESTLRRIAHGLAVLTPEGSVHSARLVQQLVDLAGPALAPESEYADRVERRRNRRRSKQIRVAVGDELVRAARRSDYARALVATELRKWGYEP